MLRPFLPALAVMLAAVPPVAAFAAAPDATAASAHARAAAAPLDVPQPNVPQTSIPGDLPATVRVHVTLDSNGCVTAASLARGGRPGPLAEAALAAARWAVFAAPATRAPRETLTLAFPALPGIEPHPPQHDRLQQAEASAAAGDSVLAVSWLVGALGEVGRDPTLREPWSLRERVIVLHRGAPKAVHSGITRTVTAVKNELDRTVHRDGHARWARELDDALAEVPWHAPLLRWRAVIAAGADARADAVRWTRLYALAAPDPEDQLRAGEALALLARGDLVRATIRLKR